MSADLLMERDAGGRCRFVRKGQLLLCLTVALLVFYAFPSLPVPAAEGGYVVGLSAYPLRDEPEFSAPSKARLGVGEKVTILEKKSGWTNIRAGDKEGWMPSSVVGSGPPPSIQLGPLTERLGEMETRLDRLVRENKTLLSQNESLSTMSETLERDLKRSLKTASNARSYQRLWGVALGGGLVIFGWVTGYALAARSGRKGSKPKYRID